MQDDSDEVWPAEARQEDLEGEPCCAGSWGSEGFTQGRGELLGGGTTVFQMLRVEHQRDWCP